MNSVTWCHFVEGRINLFGAEVFNNFSVVIVVLEPCWKQHIHTTYKPQYVVMGKCLFVLGQKFAFLCFYLVNQRCCTQLPGTSCSSDGKLSNGTKIAAIFLVFTICI